MSEIKRMASVWVLGSGGGVDVLWGVGHGAWPVDTVVGHWRNPSAALMQSLSVANDVDNGQNDAEQGKGCRCKWDGRREVGENSS